MTEIATRSVVTSDSDTDVDTDTDVDEGIDEEEELTAFLWPPGSYPLGWVG